MVSKIQWKPFWFATQLYPQNDCTGWQNGVNDDECRQASLTRDRRVLADDQAAWHATPSKFGVLGRCVCQSPGEEQVNHLLCVDELKMP